MSQKEDKVLKEFLMEQLGKGYIQPSKCQYASSFFFISKKDRKLRPVQDYQCINDHTIQNQYSLPLITDLIMDLHVFWPHQFPYDLPNNDESYLSPRYS